MSDDLKTWYENHKEDYQAVKERLFSARQTLLYGSIKHAAENLRLSYLNAVFSIQTKKERHERAFTAYVRGFGIEEACGMVVYPNQKADWINRTMKTTDWVEVAKEVRAYVKNDQWEALLGMESDLVGVSHTKWSFTLCMCGVTELACFDTNVRQFFGLDKRSRGSAGDYLDMINMLQDQTDISAESFVIQWTVYDYQRGEHARHMPFFRNIALQ
jgi:hypothetical protein